MTGFSAVGGTCNNIQLKFVDGIKDKAFFQSLMALPGNHAEAQGGQGGGAVGGSDKLPESPPFAPPSLV